MELIRRVTPGIPNLEVDMSSELLSDYAKRKRATIVVKGLRAVSDYEKECQMALINRKLNPKLDTMFLPARQNFTYRGQGDGPLSGQPQRLCAQGDCRGCTGENG